MPLTASDIEDLITLSSGESEVLEFKSELPAFNDKGKAEFLKDVCAMANASGGAILYGIQELDGCASNLTIRMIEEKDALLRRLAQLSQDNIEPALRIAFSICVVNEHEVLVVEVPQSFSGPHRFKFNDKQRFVRRYDRHIADMTYPQLRASFGSTEGRLNEIKSWWDRVEPSDYFARTLSADPSMLSALVPIAYDGRLTLLDPQKVEKHSNDLIMANYGGLSVDFNYHGLSGFPGPRHEAVSAFTQVERLGPILTWRSIEDLRHGRSENLFHGAWYVDFLRQSLRTQRRVFKRHGISGSFLFFAKFQGLSDWKMIDDGLFSTVKQREGTSNSIESGPVFINNINELSESATEIFADHVDRLWQSYGHASCPTKYLEET